MQIDASLIDILSIITTIGIMIIGYILAGLNKRIDRVETRQDKVDSELKEINSRLGKIEGLLEGYFARSKD